MILDLLNYTKLADKRIIDVLIKAEKPLPEANILISHILNSQHIWFKRISKEDILFDRFQIHPLTDLEEIHLSVMREILNLYHTRDLKEQIIYSNQSGEEFVNSIEDILIHLANHSTYHRAQIAAQLRANGLTPPITDYIAFKREGLL